MQLSELTNGQIVQQLREIFNTSQLNAVMSEIDKYVQDSLTFDELIFCICEHLEVDPERSLQVRAVIEALGKDWENSRQLSGLDIRALLRDHGHSVPAVTAVIRRKLRKSAIAGSITGWQIRISCVDSGKKLPASLTRVYPSSRQLAKKSIAKSNTTTTWSHEQAQIGN